MPANKEDVNTGDIIMKLFTTGWERGKVEDIKKGSPSQKREAKDFAVPRLVRHVLDSSYWLHDLGDEDTVHLTEEQFKNLEDGGTEADEGVSVGAWCIVRHVPSQLDVIDHETDDEEDDDE